MENIKSVVLFPPFNFVFKNSNLLSYIANNFKQLAHSPCNRNHFPSVSPYWAVIIHQKNIISKFWKKCGKLDYSRYSQLSLLTLC